MKERARELRKKQTDAEAKLWSVLRNNNFQGLKFRRQHCIPPYIVDFICLNKKLIIELDSGQHLLQMNYKTLTLSLSQLHEAAIERGDSLESTAENITEASAKPAFSDLWVRLRLHPGYGRNKLRSM